jgi:hypothetical protein
MVAVEPLRLVIDGRGKAQDFFFKTDPHLYPYTGPQEKAGFVIKGGEKNSLLESLGALFGKPY